MVLYHYYSIFYSPAGRDQLFLFFPLPIIVMVIRFPWRRSRHRCDPAANGHCNAFEMRVVARWPPLRMIYIFLHRMYCKYTQTHALSEVQKSRRSRSPHRADVHRKMRIRCINHAPGWWERDFCVLCACKFKDTQVAFAVMDISRTYASARCGLLALQSSRDKNNLNVQWWRISNSLFLLCSRK